MKTDLNCFKKINSARLNPNLLGKYIPNLIAKPFEVIKEYAQIIYDQTTGGEVVAKSWPKALDAAVALPLAATAVVLMLVCLAAYLSCFVFSQAIFCSCFRLVLRRRSRIICMFSSCRCSESRWYCCWSAAAAAARSSKLSFRSRLTIGIWMDESRSLGPLLVLTR